MSVCCRDIICTSSVSIRNNPTTLYAAVTVLSYPEFFKKWDFDINPRIALHVNIVKVTIAVAQP